MKKQIQLFGFVCIMAMNLFLQKESEAQSMGPPVTYEPYTCNICTLDTLVPDADLIEFIRNVVNQDVPMWRPKDKVKICNHTLCVTYQYGGMGNFIVIKKEGNRNSGHQENNGVSGRSASRVGSAGRSWSLVPVYSNATVCAGGACNTERVLVGYRRF